MGRSHTANSTLQVSRSEMKIGINGSQYHPSIRTYGPGIQKLATSTPLSSGNKCIYRCCWSTEAWKRSQAMQDFNNKLDMKSVVKGQQSLNERNRTANSPKRDFHSACKPFRNVSRTGLCPDFFLRGCSTPISQSRWDSQSDKQPRTVGSHIH